MKLIYFFSTCVVLMIAWLLYIEEYEQLVILLCALFGSSSMLYEIYQDLKDE